VRVLLISTYELGHQPLHVASPAAALRNAGHDVRALDLSVSPWDDEAVAWANRVAFSVPMHTAMRLAVAGARRIRRDDPGKPVCFYGLYAAVGRDATVGALADVVIAGEYEPALVAWAGGTAHAGGTVVHLGRSTFAVPARDLLPPLDRYARLAVGGEERLAASVEASHGCSHRCRHCPLPVVYDGRIRVVPEDVVLADVEQLVRLGARHVSFGDPDFLNGPHHSLRVVRAMHDAFPEVTFDCTTKVEHVLRHRDVWPELASAGCLFVVSALESVDDAILRILDKGHTAAEGADAIAVLRANGIEPRPSFLPFTPWTTPAGVADLFDFVAAHDLIGNVDPVQYSIRLLLPDGSLLLDRPELQPYLGDYDPELLSWSWQSADPGADALQQRLAAVVEEHAASAVDAAATWPELDALVREAAGRERRRAVPETTGDRPRLTEPWFCCAEPTEAQLGAV
jgi:radical SAM superfamily enzyme YgiQ (UPF0313 family)